MELTVNIKCDALVEAIYRICDVIEGQSTRSTVKPETKTEKPSKPKAVKAKTKPTGEEKEAEETEQDEEISLETVRAALVKLTKDKGKDAAKNILADFGATKLTDVDPTVYAEFLEAIKEA